MNERDEKHKNSEKTMNIMYDLWFEFKQGNVRNHGELKPNVLKEVRNVYWKGVCHGIAVLQHALDPDKPDPDLARNLCVGCVKEFLEKHHQSNVV